MGRAKVYFSLSAVEAFSVLRLILVARPLITLEEMPSQHPPHAMYTNTHHMLTMSSFTFEVYFLILLIPCYMSCYSMI